MPQKKDDSLFYRWRQDVCVYESLHNGRKSAVAWLLSVYTLDVENSVFLGQFFACVYEGGRVFLNIFDPCPYMVDCTMCWI